MITGPTIDRFSFVLAMSISSGACDLLALLLFGFATSLPLILVFALLFGAAISLQALPCEDDAPRSPAYGKVDELTLFFFCFVDTDLVRNLTVVVGRSKGGGFGCFLMPVARDVAMLIGSENALQFLAYMFIRGVAAVTGPLIGSALYRPSQIDERHPGPNSYGINGFKGLIVFVGSTMVGASLVALAAYKWRHIHLSRLDPSRSST